MVRVAQIAPLLVSAALGAFCLAACSEKARVDETKPTAEVTPPAKTPPPLGGSQARVATPNDVAPSMWALATETDVLRSLAARSAAPDEKDRAEMTRRLERIRALLETLAAIPDAQKHPLLRDGLVDFQRDVEAASEAAQREQVDVDAVRAVANACKRCHVVAARAIEHESALARR